MSLRGGFSLYRLFCCLGMTIVFLSGSVCQAELLLRADKPTVVFEQGVKYIAGDTKVVNLQGTWRQMGRQYGKLLDKELRDVYFDKLQPFMAEHPDKKELLQRMAEACYQSNAYKL